MSERHPPDPSTKPRWPLGRNTTVLCVLLLLIFALLRFGAAGGEPPSTSKIATTKVVLIGVAGRYQPTTTDDKIITSNAARTQTGALSIRTRYQGACAAAGWVTIGAGRRAAVGDHCRPQVNGSGRHARVSGWSAIQAAVSANAGDARLGTLSRLSSDCIQAVGPGAALAAARPDGTLSRYQTPEQFAADGYRPHCPVTIVDAGNKSGVAIKALTKRKDTTTIVAGIGPPAGSDRQDLQLVYRVGTTMPGAMTSDSTRRAGVITLTDLNRTLVDFGSGGRADRGQLDGATIEVHRGRVSTDRAAGHLDKLANLSHVAPTGYVVAGGAALLIAAAAALFLLRRRWTAARVSIGALTIWTAALLLPGTYPWAAQPHPTLALLTMLIMAGVLSTAGALLIARLGRVPIPVAAAMLTAAAFTLDAALGTWMEPGSLLNSRPVNGGRWYGFGNATFGCYAAAMLTVIGYLAHRFRGQGRRIAPVVTVVILGGLAIYCVGSPQMGADFGGMSSLTPVVLGLALVVSGLRITWARVVLVMIAAVIVVAGVSVLDWARGAGQRSHLGDFVQRVITGDAIDIIRRKGVMELQTMITPYGIPAIIGGVLIWIVVLRRVRHRITPQIFPGYTATAVTVLAVGVLGGLLNDLGIAVWVTTFGTFAATTTGLLVDRYAPDVWPASLELPGQSRAGPGGSAPGRSDSRRISSSNASRSGNPARRDPSDRR